MMRDFGHFELEIQDCLRIIFPKFSSAVSTCRYTTRSLKRQGTDHHLQQAKVPYGKILDVIIVDTELFQV